MADETMQKKMLLNMKRQSRNYSKWSREKKMGKNNRASINYGILPVS